MIHFTRLALALSLVALPALADFSYTEKTQATGGKLVKMMSKFPGGKKITEPTISKVSVQGNRMANVSAERISIIDADKATMTEIDLKEKTYSVITFDEMKEALAAMSKAMQKKMAEEGKQMEMSYSFDVKETGQSQQLQGYDTKEFLLKAKMSMKSKDPAQPAAADMDMDINMWMAKEVAGYNEVRKFYLAMAEKMNFDPVLFRMAPMMASQNEGMAKAMKEARKLEGIPLLQTASIMSLGGGDLPDFPGFPPMKDVMADEVSRTAANEAAWQTARATGGRFGGLAGAAAGGIMGGMMRGKKKQEPEKPEKPAEAPKPAAPSPLIETKTEMMEFSSAAVDSAVFAIPPGLKQVEHPIKKAVKDLEKQ
jgi:hypothetical protein